jgi:hypothetical protein
MNKYQPIFDTAYLSIVDQGAPGYDQTARTCSYFSTDMSGRELRCAVGHLLPDEMAREIGSAMMTVSELADQIIPVVADQFGIDLNEYRAYQDLTSFLSDLQHAHDESADLYDVGGADAFIRQYRDHMHLVAEEYELSTKVLDR